MLAAVLAAGLLQCKTAAVAATRRCDSQPIVPDIRLTGGAGQLGQVASVPSAAACRSRCCALPNCTAWTLDAGGGAASSHACHRSGGLLHCCTLHSGHGLVPHRSDGAVPSVSGWMSDTPPPTSFGPIRSLGGLTPREPQFSGYAQVSPTTALFYHLVQSRNASAPLLLWTNGGPGASSIEYGDFFQLIGPFSVDAASGALRHNNGSWSEHFSLLFIDHPAPTGLSFSTAPPADQTANSQQYVAALQVILGRHAGVAKHGMYMGGESYAGRFVPAIAREILARHLPLRGIMIGNGEVDPVSAFASYGDWLFNLGYIQESQLQDLQERGRNCTALAGDTSQLTAASEVCYSIRRAATEAAASGYWDYDVRYGGSGPFGGVQKKTTAFLDLPRTRQELHALPPARLGSISAGGVVAWAGFNRTNDFVRSGIPDLEALLRIQGFRALIYTGNFDECMNVRSTSNWMKKIGKYGPAGDESVMVSFLALPRLPVRDVGEATVGYTRRAGGLSQFILLRSGHMCTLEQPNVSRQMFRDFVAGDI
jgi:carboxypeptidase C (cathepsin A)